MSDQASPRHLSPPPRRVPLALSIRVVLGGLLGQVGWFMVGFGFIFVWAFDATGAVASAVRFAGELATVEGTVTGWRELNLEINGSQVYEMSYAFEQGGRSYAGRSFQTGQYVPEGVSVVIEYRPSDPGVSRIQTMSASAVGLPIAFVFLIPLIGLALARAGLRSGLRARRLLSEGHLALGRLKSEEPTNMRVNNRPVVKLTFEFMAQGGGTYEAVVSTHDTRKVTDEEQERLVYDPRYPSDATLIDHLPGNPTIDSRGDFEAGGAREVVLALLNLVVPAATVFGHGAYLLFFR